MKNKYLFTGSIGLFVMKIISPRIFSIVMIMLFITACSNSGPEDGVSEAQSLYQRGEYQAAIIVLKKTLKNYPNNAEARFALGDIHLEVGDVKGAIKELVFAKNYGVTDKRLPILLAKAYLMDGEYDKALNSITVPENSPGGLKIEMMLLQVSALLGKGETDKAEKLLLATAALEKNNVDVLLAQSRFALSRGRYPEAEGYLGVLSTVDPENDDGAILRGMLYLQQGMHKDASNEFVKVIAQQAGKRFTRREFSARVGYVQSLLSLGEVRTAEKAIQDFLLRSPDHPIPLYFKAVMSYENREYSVVKDTLQRVLAAMPNHYPSLLLLGAANFSDKNYEQANEFLTKFVDRVPTHLYARKLLGATRLRLNRSDEALEILKEGVSDAESDEDLLELIGRVAMRTDIKSAVSYFENASGNKPEDTALRKQLAKVYIASGKLDKAIEELKFVGGESALQAESLKVFAYLREKDFAKARSLAEKLINENANDTRFYMLRASVEVSAGYKQAAEKYLKKAVEIKNDNTLAMVSLAKLKIQSGELDVAAEWFERVTNIQPKNLSASLGLAEIAERQGHPKIAIEILQKASENHPGEYVPQAALAGYFLQKGLAKDARDLLAKAVKINDHPNLWNLLGQSHEALKNLKDASDSYQRVISLAPKSAVAHVSLARVFSIMGDKKKAENHYGEALKIIPGYAPARAGLANLAISESNFTKANVIGRELIANSPKSPIGFLVLANSALGQKKYLDAKNQFINAFELGLNRSALVHAYTIFSKANRKKLGTELLVAWLKTNPKDTVSRLMLATNYQETGNEAAAEEQYRLLLVERPSDLVALNNLALLRLPNDPAEAKKLAALAYEQAKSNAAIADTYGWVLVQNHDYKQGLQILEYATKVNQHPDIQYHLAFALSKMGQTQRAKSILSDILAASPAFAERVPAEQLLDSIK